MLSDPRFVVSMVKFHSEDVIGIVATSPTEFCEPLPHTSPVIAAFCTAWARLELYKCLENLGRRVLYMDTDRYITNIFLSSSRQGR